MPAGIRRPKKRMRHRRTLIGSGIGGIAGIAETALVLHERGPRRVSPFFIPGRLINLASGQVRSAMAEGAEPFGRHRLLDRRARHRRCRPPDHARRCRCHGRRRHRIADLAAFRSPALPPAGRCRPRNDDPQKASRPYDSDRDGFVMGEGAGVVVLEELEHAKARGAKIYAEVVGYGLSGDAYHITAPSEDGDGAYRCMKAALQQRKNRRLRHRLRQCPRHLDHGRHDRTWRRRAVHRQRRRQGIDVVDQIGDRPSAWRRRRRRGDFLHSGYPRPDCAADAQSRQSGSRNPDRSRAAQGQASARSTPPCPIPSALAEPMPR